MPKVRSQTTSYTIVTEKLRPSRYQAVCLEWPDIKDQGRGRMAVRRAVTQRVRERLSEYERRGELPPSSTFRVHFFHINLTAIRKASQLR